MGKRVGFTVSVLLAAFSCPSASAQGGAARATLVQAVAGVIGDSILPRLASGKPPYLAEPTTDFDAAVSFRLERIHHLARTPTRGDGTEWIVTRGVSIQGDTAAVLIEVGTRGGPEAGIDTYVERNRYLFVPTSTGWRFVRRSFVSGADFGAVRG